MCARVCVRACLRARVKTLLMYYYRCMIVSSNAHKQAEVHARMNARTRASVIVLRRRNGVAKPTGASLSY